MQTDVEQYMRQCEELGHKAAQLGNAPVGALLVVGSEIIGEGIEAGTSSGDITKHAEIEAVRDAILKGRKHLLHDATMYTTHEPCIMCSYVLRHHRVSKIIFEHKVADVGGCSSPFPVLNTDFIPKWGNPPEIIYLGPDNSGE